MSKEQQPKNNADNVDAQMAAVAPDEDMSSKELHKLEREVRKDEHKLERAKRKEERERKREQSRAQKRGDKDITKIVELTDSMQMQEAQMDSPSLNVQDRKDIRTLETVEAEQILTLNKDLENPGAEPAAKESRNTAERAAQERKNASQAHVYQESQESRNPRGAQEFQKSQEFLEPGDPQFPEDLLNSQTSKKPQENQESKSSDVPAIPMNVPTESYESSSTDKESGTGAVPMNVPTESYESAEARVMASAPAAEQYERTRPPVPDPDSVMPRKTRDDETIGLLGTRKKDFSAQYHLTRRSKAKRLRHIGKIAMQFDALQGLTPVKMRLMFEALGPTFVKVGQILSMRSEILPEAFCQELSKLRADADPMPYAVVIETLENEFKRPIDQVFAHIDATPLGSASLAQVHRATLLTGEDVAVKVQRPGVRETMAEDVSILRSLAKGATRIMHNSQVVDFQGVVEELWETFDEETNFLNEARNLCEFKRFCSHYAYMDCPTPYVDLCTEHVLVMEYIEGIPIAHTKELVADGYSLKEIGTKLVDNYAAQILDTGFFHADPHPGNIEIRGGRIILLDLGMTGRLSASVRSALQAMLYAVAKQDSAGLADALLRFANTETDRIDYPSLLADLDSIVEQFGTVDLADLDLASFLNSLIQMARRHGIEVPSSVTTVGRALVTLEGTLDEFIPDVNMIEIITQHIANDTTPKEAVKKELKDLGVEGHQALHAGLKAVNEANVALHMLTRGELRMNMEIVGSEEPMSQMSDMVNRLTMALIVVGLFVGSSIVYFAGMKPIIFGIPVVGFMGYVVAFVLSMWIVVDIYVKGKAPKRRKSK